MIYRSALISVALSLAAMTAHAQTQVTTSRMYLFNPDPNDVKNSIDALEAAIGSRGARPGKHVGLVPSSLPEKPGEPVSKPFRMGPVSIHVTDCGDSYGRISAGSSTSGGILGSSGESFFGCAYLSQSGIRLSIILEQKTSSSGNLMGSLLTGIRDSIRGDDQKFGRETFEKMANLVRQKVPGVLVELIELPGGDITRPDAEKVAKLLTKAPAGLAQDGGPVGAPAQAQAPAAEPAKGPEASPSQTQSNAAQAIEARKQLTAMGLQYFSIEHFQDAISRRDILAVKLFLQADAVKVRVPGPKGQTAVQVAQSTGDAELLEMLERAGH